MNKLISVFIVTLFVVACAQDKSYTEKLQEQILESYNTPIRPGYEGRNPYWNKFAKKFSLFLQKIFLEWRLFMADNLWESKFVR